jgi:hypothetical protein
MLSAAGAAEMMSAVLSEALPWTTFLPDDHRASFIEEFLRTIEASASLDNFAPVGVVLQAVEEHRGRVGEPRPARTARRRDRGRRHRRSPDRGRAVPAMSEKTANFPLAAASLLTAAQTLTVVANGLLTAKDGKPLAGCSVSAGPGATGQPVVAWPVPPVGAPAPAWLLHPLSGGPPVSASLTRH